MNLEMHIDNRAYGGKRGYLSECSGMDCTQSTPAYLLRVADKTPPS